MGSKSKKSKKDKHSKHDKHDKHDKHKDDIYVKANHHMSKRKRKEMEKRRKKAKRKARLCCFCKVFWILVLIAAIAVVIAYVVLAMKGYNVYANNVIMKPIRARALFEDSDDLKGKLEFSLFYQGKEDLSMDDITAKVKSPNGNVVIEAPLNTLVFDDTIKTIDLSTDLSKINNSKIVKELKDIRDKGNDANWEVKFEGGPLKAMGIKSFKKASEALNKADVKLQTTGPYY